jgi:hypothetical protein
VPDVTVTFANAMAGGVTTVETADQNPQPDPTMTFIPPFHQIASTATYDLDIQICIGYDQASLPGGQPEANLRIAQLVGGNWSIIPAPPGTVDESGNVVCAPTAAVGWVVVVGT